MSYVKGVAWYGRGLATLLLHRGGGPGRAALVGAGFKLAARYCSCNGR